MTRRGLLQALAGVLVGSRLAAKLAPPIAWVDEPAGPVQYYYLRNRGTIDRLRIPLTYTFDDADLASYYTGAQWNPPVSPPGR